MNKEDICYMPAYEMAEKIKIQELTSLEITEILIERIEKINPIINAYCTPTFDLARDMAKKADNAVKKGVGLGLLHGIPISIKDDTQIKGIRTTMGSKIFENFISPKDEIEVKRLRKDGCVILGKTNIPAFGFKGSTDNLIFGATKNPWDITKTCGGSSGGAASAVASGLGSIATGSDAAGSIRIPSSFCGVYGLKPSFGLIPHTAMNVFGQAGTIIHKGPITRCVNDAALFLDSVVGMHSSDRYSLPKPNISYFEKVQVIPKDLKLGFSLNFGFAKAIESDVKEIFLNAIQKYEKLEWNINELKIKLRFAESSLWVLALTGWTYLLKRYLDQWSDKLDPVIIKAIELGKKYSVDDIKLAEIQREMVNKEICKHFKDCDIILTPTVPCKAFELGKMAPEEIEGFKIDPMSFEWVPCSYPLNLTGHPAASIPCGWSTEGLPIGMQIIGRRLEDFTVLQASKAFEEIQPWQDKRPQFN
jgi:aspartyl-tRNA(Asn)/glutamyl-tRNA(Gln) amidotransferase subunit A